MFTRAFPGRFQRVILLAGVLFASYAYFYEGGGWNQNVRFDLVRAIVERHTLQIDVYQDNTGDKAEVGGHVYADKAPGASFVAVPAVFAARLVLRAVGHDVYTREAIVFLSYVSTIAGAALPAMLAALCVYRLSIRFGATANAAACGALVCGLGTPLWAYATILYGHALAAGCLAAALLTADSLADPLTDAQIRRRGLLVGLAASWAVVTEFPAAPPAGLMVVLAVWQFRRADAVRQRMLWAGLAVGAAIGAVVLLGYNTLAFGSPLHLGYASETAGYEGMHRGIFGVYWPQPDVALALLFGLYRGLLPLAPVLIVAPIGWWLLGRDPRARATVAVAALSALYYFVMTAGYAYWDGGWSYASRHLAPALPMLALGIAPLWQRGRTLTRAALLLLALLGVGQSLVAVATTPQPPGLAVDDPLRVVLWPPSGDSSARPMMDLLWPAFVSGDFPIGWQSVLEKRAPAEPPSELERRGVPRASWNLGQQAGLDGHASLLPLLAIWGAAAAGWAALGRSREQ